MKWIAGIVAVGLSLSSLPQIASAQAVAVGGSAASGALGEARSRLVCGTATLVSAQYLGNGSLRVTCRQDGPDQRQSQNGRNPLEGGLTAQPAAVAVIAVGVLGALIGSKNSSTTTSTAPVYSDR